MALRNEQLEAQVIKLKNTVNKLLKYNLKLKNDLEDQKKINEFIMKENEKINTTNQSCELDTRLIEINKVNHPPPLKKRKLVKPWLIFVFV